MVDEYSSYQKSEESSSPPLPSNNQKNHPELLMLLERTTTTISTNAPPYSHSLPAQLDTHLSLDDPEEEIKMISNNQVLGIAFYSFLGFTIVQTTFAIKAKSSAMMADSAAMFVDSASYLFNMVAERLKSRSLSEEEQKLPLAVLEHKLKLQRNYLELFPPFLSVVTLLYVTFVTLDASIHTLSDPHPHPHPFKEKHHHHSKDEPNAEVMMVFSILNLLLDILNVTCFARVHQAILIPMNFDNKKTAEDTPLMISNNMDETLGSTTLETSLGEDDISDNDELINLNMCSAWTHVFADTLRSVAVLLAGSLSYFTQVISPTKADAAAALVVSLVIFLSCVPLVRGMAKTLYEIIHMRQSPIMSYWRNASSSSNGEDRTNFEMLV